MFPSESSSQLAVMPVNVLTVSPFISSGDTQSKRVGQLVDFTTSRVLTPTYCSAADHAVQFWMVESQAGKEMQFACSRELRLTVRDIFLFVRPSQTLPHPPLSFRLSTSYGEMICWLPRKSFLLTNIFTPQSNALPRLFTSYTINYSQSFKAPTFWGLIWSTIQWLSVKSSTLPITIEYSL